MARAEQGRGETGLASWCWLVLRRGLGWGSAGKEVCRGPALGCMQGQLAGLRAQQQQLAVVGLDSSVRVSERHVTAEPPPSAGSGPGRVGDEPGRGLARKR